MLKAADLSSSSVSNSPLAGSSVVRYRPFGVMNRSLELPGSAVTETGREIFRSGRTRST